MSTQSLPLSLLFFIAFWDSLHPNNACIDERTSHIEEVLLNISPHFVSVAAYIPAVEEDIIENIVESALFHKHVVKLVNNRDLQNDVLPWVVCDHGCELIDLSDISSAEAVRIDGQ